MEETIDTTAGTDGAASAEDVQSADGAPDADAGGGRHGLSSFPLKVLAIVGMTCNHFCHIFEAHLSDQVVCALYGFGGLTFPIMAFLLVVGYAHTSSVARYAQRLGLFALISQIPYGLFLGTNLNVMFTLLIGLVLLWLNDRMKNRTLYWVATVALIAASALCDWGVIGPTMILMMRMLPRRRDRVVLPLLLPIVGYGLPALSDLVAAPSLALLPDVLYLLGGCTATIPLLLSYNGRRGRPMKWLFYVYYPAHILVLGLLRGLLLGDWTLAA